MGRRKLYGSSGCELQMFGYLDMLEFTQRLNIGEHSTLKTKMLLLCAGTWCLSMNLESRQMECGWEIMLVSAVNASTS